MQESLTGRSCAGGVFSILSSAVSCKNHPCRSVSDLMALPLKPHGCGSSMVMAIAAAIGPLRR